MSEIFYIFEKNCNIMKIQIPRLRTMLPKLKTFFGFQIRDITDELFEVYNQQAQEGRINEELAKAHTYISNDHPTIRVADYVMATNDNIRIAVSSDFVHQIEAIRSLCEHAMQEDYKDCAWILSFMAALLNRDMNTIGCYSATEGFEWNQENYTHNIRPELLRLYVARNDRGGKYHKSCAITFGATTTPIQANFPWFEKMLDSYFHRFLGVNSVEEAKSELESIYSKKVGHPLDRIAATYIWGTFHLLQSLPSMASENPKSCSRPQSRFIADYLNIIGLINILDSDSEAIRSRLNNYLKKFNSLEEMLAKQEYRNSPNNPSQVELY